MDTSTYSNICIQKYTKEQDLEICAIQLNTQKKYSNYIMFM